MNGADLSGKTCELLSEYIAAIDATTTDDEASIIKWQLLYFVKEFSKWADVAAQRAVTNRKNAESRK